MDNKDIFTIDKVNYPLKETQEFIQRQSEQGRFVVTILDPGVTVKDTLPAYYQGLQQDIFIRSGHSDEYYEGEVWPGWVHFVDFLSPRSTDYWTALISDFKDRLDFAGLWLDMCEPACFTAGHKGNTPLAPFPSEYTLNYPPFAINNANSEVEIFYQTISMDARHIDGSRHLEVHNVYGFSESLRTAEALERLQPGLRHFLLTRSTFPGSGRFTAHWLGDNYSDFDNLSRSISGVLDFQLFGIPMVGSDLCGFLGKSDEELCARWMALGAFHPFARNHYSKESEPQEPYRWESVTRVTKKYYALRYSLLPYWYTLHWQAHKTGRPIIRPLFFEFPEFTELYTNDQQFMVGSALLVAPVIKRGSRSVAVALPPGVWYNLENLDAAPIMVQGELYQTCLEADLETIPVLLRGGHIVLRQDPGLTIRDTLQGQYHLIVPLDVKGMAFGTVYFDDGISANPLSNYSKLDIIVQCATDICTLRISGYFGFTVQGQIRSITLLSAVDQHRKVQQILLGKQEILMSTGATEYSLKLAELSIDLNEPKELDIHFCPSDHTMKVEGSSMGSLFSYMQ